MSREHKFETFEHTADIGVIGRGSTKAEAFENIAYGMFSIMADLSKYSPTNTIEEEVSEEDDVELLERFLSSMLVVFDADAVLPLDFEITELEDGHLKCTISVRPFGEDIEWNGPQVKAVTYHQMDVKLTDGEWCAQAILDV